MRKIMLIALGALLLTAVVVTAAIQPQMTYTPGTVLVDSIRWKASGALPGTAGVKVDTIVVALDDTSMSSFFIGGCKWAAFSVVFSEGNKYHGENAAGGYYGVAVQTGPDANGGIWVTQSEVATQTQRAGNSADTVTQMIIQPDSFLTGSLTGTFRSQTRVDYMRARAHNWVRFIVINTETTGDSCLIRGVVTRVW